MSFEPDDKNHETSLEDLIEQQNLILHAILLGIEIIADQDQGTLLEDAANED